MWRLLHVRHLPCLCPRGPAGPDPGDAGRRGRDARRHRQPPEAEQPPLLPARRLAADGGARGVSARDADLTLRMMCGLIAKIDPGAGRDPSISPRASTSMGPDLRRDLSLGP